MSKTTEIVKSHWCRKMRLKYGYGYRDQRSRHYQKYLKKIRGNHDLICEHCDKSAVWWVVKLTPWLETTSKTLCATCMPLLYERCQSHQIIRTETKIEHKYCTIVYKKSAIGKE